MTLNFNDKYTLTMSLILFKSLMEKDLNIYFKIKLGIIYSELKINWKAGQYLKYFKKKQKVLIYDMFGKKS